MNEHPEYKLNNGGSKMPNYSTRSYDIFIDELGKLELFILYILMAENSDKDSFKSDLVEHFKTHNNPFSKGVVNFLKSDKTNTILSSDHYELLFGQMAFSRIVDNSLSYFKEILGEVVRVKPEVLKSNEKEPLDYILSFNTMEDLIFDISERKIQKLFYGSVIDIKKFFKDRLGIELFENQHDEKNFDQIVKQRNLIVHNRGIITQELIDISNYPIELLGKPLHYRYGQLSELNKIVNNIIVEIDIKLRIKFNLNTSKFEI